MHIAALESALYGFEGQIVFANVVMPAKSFNCLVDGSFLPDAVFHVVEKFFVKSYIAEFVEVQLFLRGDDTANLAPKVFGHHYLDLGRVNFFIQLVIIVQAAGVHPLLIAPGEFGARLLETLVKEQAEFGVGIQHKRV